MKRKTKIFWICYIVWSALNIALLIMALNDTFGEFNKSAEKFWPFSVGSPASYDYIELAVYLAMPLIFYLGWRLVHHHDASKERQEKISIARNEIPEEG
jgi:hypothetical protein